MLVLTRRRGESVVVTGLSGATRELKISVVAIRGRRVRLGFEADAEVAIDRAEVSAIHADETEAPVASAAPTVLL